MTGDLVAANVFAAIVLMPIVWFLLRDVRSAMSGFSRQLSDLTLAIALDVATRPTANESARRLANELAVERTGRNASAAV